jgi:hypothetical protein
MTGGRQLSVDGTSRVTGDGQARFREGLGVKFPGATRPWRVCRAKVSHRSRWKSGSRRCRYALIATREMEG